MDGDDEVVNVVFMLCEKRVDMALVDELCALGLGKDKVAEEDKTDRGVER